MRKAWGLFGAQGIFASFSEQWGRTERHGATSVNLDGDVSMAGEERKKGTNVAKASMSEEEKERRKAAAGAAAAQEKANVAAGKDERSSEGGRATTSAAKTSDASHEIVTSQQQTSADAAAQQSHGEDKEEEDEEEEDSDMIHGEVAVKFLLAGGIAGAVSRTATAPFDRLKIYLITTSRQQQAFAPPSGAGVTDALKGARPGAAEAVAKKTAQSATRSFGLMYEAIRALYLQGGGMKSFWVGNGLNCIKIFPVSGVVKHSAAIVVLIAVLSRSTGRA